MKSNSTKASEIERKWYIFDAKGEILGRLATQIAIALMGKNKPYFVRHLDCGDHVVVINAFEVAVTGRKEKQKMYYRHSGYPGGLKTTALEDVRRQHPERIIESAVRGMLPINKLRDRMLLRLHVYAGSEHPYTEKFN